jgi:probable F420-dependent oxidoreductase
MHFGVSMFHTDYSIPAVQLAQALEERGFESVWAPEHSHIPVPRRTPFPGGGEVPKPYYEVMDPFVVLSAAAAVTKTLKLATGVCLVVQRDPIQTAKLVASIDQVSGGRFLFGVGGGWNAEEIEDHGTAFKTRFKVMRERIEAMKEIWTKDKAEYHGEFVDLPTMMTWPKPAQKPYPPIIVGGAFPLQRGAPSATATDGCRLPAGLPMAMSTSTCRSSNRWSLRPTGSPKRCRSLCSAAPRMPTC